MRDLLLYGACDEVSNNINRFCPPGDFTYFCPPITEFLLSFKYTVHAAKFA